MSWKLNLIRPIISLSTAQWLICILNSSLKYVSVMCRNQNNILDKLCNFPSNWRPNAWDNSDILCADSSSFYENKFDISNTYIWYFRPRNLAFKKLLFPWMLAYSVVFTFNISPLTSRLCGPSNARWQGCSLQISSPSLTCVSLPTYEKMSQPNFEIPNHEIAVRIDWYLPETQKYLQSCKALQILLSFLPNSTIRISLKMY